MFLLKSGNLIQHFQFLQPRFMGDSSIVFLPTEGWISTTASDLRQHISISQARVVKANVRAVIPSNMNTFIYVTKLSSNYP